MRKTTLPPSRSISLSPWQRRCLLLPWRCNDTVDTCEYTVTKGETTVNPVTAVNGDTPKPVALQFNKPETTSYSGTYNGTVIFTVSVKAP